MSAGRDRPQGILAVVVGPDGVGKTTLAKLVLERVSRPHAYVHFCPPSRGPLPALPPEGRPVAIDKHPDPEFRVISWVRLARSVWKFWLGYIRTIRPILNEGGIVVADRWCYGYLAQPYALRYWGPAWLARAAIKIMPTPDCVINLKADPHVIWSRKQELPVETISQELSAWGTIPHPALATLDASSEPEHVAAKALEWIHRVETGG